VRVAEEMRSQNISAQKAQEILRKDDEERYRWSSHLYRIDTRDPSLYDLVIHIKCMTTDAAVDIICKALEQPCFQTTPESQKAVDILLLAAQVQAALVEEFPAARVEVEEGEILVKIGGPWAEDKRLIAKVDQVVDNLSGLKVKVRLVSP
jgi:hypothetical protein